MGYLLSCKYLSTAGGSVDKYAEQVSCMAYTL